MDLSQEKCVPCSLGTEPLNEDEIKSFMDLVDDQWIVDNNGHLFRKFKFKDFAQALDFTNKVGKVAETEGHHPDIFLAWGKVEVTLFTHKIKGLSDNDFILASKIDKLV
ncbi:MAG: 4a-hydroxytetrahydrobiopterin dehydratase [Firmicutes bacterium]|jgi:4a-hydroxytetrahydrobiopterin dehydratase|nr:4a-hydroxytetrahydrobiopterin dehydratase [Bacillota bacterium]